MTRRSVPMTEAELVAILCKAANKAKFKAEYQTQYWKFAICALREAGVLHKKERAMSVRGHVYCFIAACFLVAFVWPLCHDREGNLCFGQWERGWCVAEKGE